LSFSTKAILEDIKLPDYKGRHVFTAKLRLVIFFVFWIIGIFFFKTLWRDAPWVPLVISLAFLMTGVCYQNILKNRALFISFILDPPAFVKGRSALKGAIRGYKEINLRALQLINPGGILVTSSCSQNLSLDEFVKVLAGAAHDAHRQVQVLEVLGQAPDHPWLPTMPESRYLKCLILKVE